MDNTRSVEEQRLLLIYWIYFIKLDIQNLSWKKNFWFGRWADTFQKR